MVKDKAKLLSHPLYRAMQGMAKVMDGYGVDPLLGFVVPSGIGDVLTVLLSTPYVVFSFFVVRSLPLTIAVVNNILRDTLIGLIPFFVGDVFDIFYRSYGRNLRLITDYINGDPKTVASVHRKVAFSVAVMLLLLLLIALMLWVAWMLGSWLFDSINHIFLG